MGGSVSTASNQRKLTLNSVSSSSLNISSGAGNLLYRAKCLPAPQNTLIVYLSRTNNTKVLAEIIQQQIGGRLIALELQTPYPQDYHAMVQQVVRENATDYLPPLKTKLDHMEQYDFVFLGFPTWAMQLPPPVKSFLLEYNLKGKTVLPFNTNAGYGPGSSFQAIKELCPQSTVLQGFATWEAWKEMDCIWLFKTPAQKKCRMKWIIG